MESKPDMNGDCPVGASNKAKIEGLMSTCVALHETDKELWAAVNQIKNRLPLWATFLLTGLASIVTLLATLHWG